MTSAGRQDSVPRIVESDGPISGTYFANPARLAFKAEASRKAWGTSQAGISIFCATANRLGWPYKCCKASLEDTQAAAQPGLRRRNFSSARSPCLCLFELLSPSASRSLMTTVPVWPHHLYGLSKLAPAQDQLPFAQHFLQAYFLEEAACGGQSISLRQACSTVDQTASSTFQPYISYQAQSSEQQARAGQNVGRGATAKFVKGLEEAWRAPSSDETSASTQHDSRLLSSKPQQLELGSGHLTQRAEPDLLFPVSLQQIQAEAAVAQTIARTWAQATDSGLPQRCFRLVGLSWSQRQSGDTSSQMQQT